MTESIPETSWRVVRVSGILPPGFTKRFRRGNNAKSTWIGTTYWLGIPVDRVDVVPEGERWALRYRHLPIRDTLADHPGESARSPIAADAFLLLPGGRRLRFCRFRLERRAPGRRRSSATSYRPM